MKKTIEIEIPEGYEIEKEIGMNFGCIIKFKKVELQKDFNWYVLEYLKTTSKLYNKTIIDLIDNYYFSLLMESGNYDQIRFEIKIGLFKFICDELKLDWMHEIHLHYAYGYPKHSEEIKNICTPEFLSSFL